MTSRPAPTRPPAVVVATLTGMEFLDPRGAPVAPVEPYRGRTALTAGETVGLFANGFPGSVEFLEHIGVALEAGRPGRRRQAVEQGQRQRAGQ